MKNHFLFAYAGNKREEVKHIYDTFIKEILDNNNITTIIEPYCGTSVLSYYIALQHPKKYKYILNDNNKFLIELYNLIRNGKNELINNEMKKLIDRFNIYKNDEDRKKEYNKIKLMDDLWSYIFTRKYYSIRPGLYPMINHIKEIKLFNVESFPIYNFIKDENILFTNQDAVKTIENNYNDKNTLLLLDPPYISTCNDFYISNDMNIYEYLYTNNINKFKCHIGLILENIWINKLLFQHNKILESYEKTYQTSKKKTSHIIITKK